MANRWGNNGWLYFSGLQNHCRWWLLPWIKKMLTLYVMANLDSILKSRDITWSAKVHLVKAMVFPVVMYGCESWTVKKAECRKIDAFELVVLEKTLESPLNCREIQSVHPKGTQSWEFIGRTDVKAEILWPPDEESWLIGKDLDAGKDWGQAEKGMTEDEMVGWHQLNGHGRPGVLRFMGSQKVRHNWATELNWIQSQLVLHTVPSSSNPSPISTFS